MNEITITTLADLDEAFAKYSDGYLFRGQVKHYAAPVSGEVSISTSFKRHGCIPDLMFKWSHYSKAIIRAFGGGNYHDISLELSQAILQHYGWRSFFIDLTKAPHIACWFAAHQYVEKRVVQMCEDYEESPVWLVHKEASYVETDQVGHIYVVDSAALTTAGVDVHDLTQTQIEDGTLRPHVQSACLAGAIDGLLPPQSVVAHLVVEHQVLTAVCAKCGVTQLDDVFPSREQDFVLRALLDIPWQRIDADTPIPIYGRGLEIPEYDLRFVKHLPPSIALSGEFWVAENRGDVDSPFLNIPFYRLHEGAYYANTNEPFDLGEVSALLRRHRSIVVELDGLISIPEMRQDYEYEKGAYIERVDDNLVCICGLVVTHPGQVVSGMGTVVGWYYRIDGNTWTRVEHTDQCPCNNSLRHELQFSLLRILNEALREGEMVVIDKLNYVHKDIHRPGKSRA
ncbi:FRG domain-containing protein [Aromatoleum toluolicum]|uniref:FRG domain-containing protein n=1 Tax=Aromatoleum toluolicum TaxID=90060 RepID=A0ABX1NNT8_9RHOO|nr:FRG domain-containing protein [Aromatoleum toluolicum]NMG01044.1 FRG domain-containing protein [Aromatoleum toluolicum]